MQQGVHLLPVWWLKLPRNFPLVMHEDHKYTTQTMLQLV